jgi:hypothetical protein
MEFLKRNLARSNFTLDLVEIIQHDLLLVDPKKRANLATVTSKIEAWKKLCMSSAAYCLGPIDHETRLDLSPSRVTEIVSDDDLNGMNVSDELPMNQELLHNVLVQVLEAIDAAIAQETDGSMNDEEMVDALHDIMLHLQHWIASVQWILEQTGAEKADIDIGHTVPEFLDSIETHDAFLSGMIRAYMIDILDALGEWSALYTTQSHAQTK